MILTILYQVILVYFVAFIIWSTIKAKDIFDQMCGAILVIPFLLRIFGLK